MTKWLKIAKGARALLRNRVPDEGGTPPLVDFRHLGRARRPSIPLGVWSFALTKDIKKQLIIQNFLILITLRQALCRQIITSPEWQALKTRNFRNLKTAPHLYTFSCAGMGAVARAIGGPAPKAFGGVNEKAIGNPAKQHRPQGGAVSGAHCRISSFRLKKVKGSKPCLFAWISMAFSERAEASIALDSFGSLPKVPRAKRFGNQEEKGQRRSSASGN
jgi:hypothetical protein